MHQQRMVPAPTERSSQLTAHSSQLTADSVWSPVLRSWMTQHGFRYVECSVQGQVDVWPPSLDMLEAISIRSSVAQSGSVRRRCRVPTFYAVPSVVSSLRVSPHEPFLS